MSKKISLEVFVLLDSSSSMAGRKWEEAIGSINDYVHTLSKEVKDANITVATFGEMGQKSFSRVNETANDIALVRDSVKITSFKDLNETELRAYGNTPLYDATARMLNLADKRNSSKTIVLIMTDGEENASIIYNLTSIRDRIATCQTRGWEVIFLGALFDVENTAKSYGLDSTKWLNTDIKGLLRIS